MMFPDQVILAAMSHARLEYPNESCGLVVCGAYRPCDNAAPDPLTDFRVSPEDWIYAESFGPIEAVIHSHPDGPDHPSESDMASQIRMGVAFGIVPMVKGAAQPPFFWGGNAPVAPLLCRRFRWGVADCYALARDWYRSEMDVILPDFPRAPGWEDYEDLFIDNFRAAGFEPVDGPPERGDGVLLQVCSSKVNHCAVALGNSLMLHHLERRLSCKEPLGRWRRLVRMIVRRAGA